jgi:hypothetical protein
MLAGALATARGGRPRGRRLCSKPRARAVSSIHEDDPNCRSRRTDSRSRSNSTSAVAALTPFELNRSAVSSEAGVAADPSESSFLPTAERFSSMRRDVQVVSDVYGMPDQGNGRLAAVVAISLPAFRRGRSLPSAMPTRTPRKRSCREAALNPAIAAGIRSDSRGGGPPGAGAIPTGLSW